LSPDKNLWPLGIVVSCALFAAAMVGFAVFSGFQGVDLVTEEYYEKELRYQGQIDAERRAKALTDPVKVVYSSAADRLRVMLPADHVQTGLEGTLNFYRPSDAALDFEVPLAPDAQGHQVIDTSGMKNGLWKVEMQWVLEGERYSTEESLYVE
jgi:nitrogen fixation protein FixH